MHKLKVSQISSLFAGCFLGAGFVSGQELLQFFAAFGFNGFYGLILSVLILWFCGVIVFRTSQLSRIFDMEKIVVPWNIPWLYNLCGILQAVFLIGIVVIMISAGSALVHQLTSVPQYIAGLIFTIILAFLAFQGLHGVISILSFAVPAIILITVLCCIISISQNNFLFNSIQEFKYISNNPLLPNWYTAAITFAAYNMFSTIGILSPFGKFVSHKKDIFSGITLGCIYIIFIAFSILISIFTNVQCVNYELPMLAVASNVNPILGYLYGILLLLGIFSSALSSIAAFLNYLSQKCCFIYKNFKLSVIVCAVLAFSGSLWGFGNLISTVYPVWGYLSFVFLILLSIHFIHLKNSQCIK